MNKAKTYEYMSDYIDGNMTDQELEKFEDMLSDNLDLKKEVQEIKALREKIKSMEPLKLPDVFDIKLKESIHKLKTTKRFIIFDNPIIVTMASVAAIFIFFTITTLFTSNNILENTFNTDEAGYNYDIAYEEETDFLEEETDFLEEETIEENYNDLDDIEGL